MAYDPKKVEPKWQKYWEDNGTFLLEVDPAKQKLYVLDMFPYPSGAGLHVGHPEGYTATDIYCRHKRMRGFNVLHPMGWDAFGLPAERYAIRTGIHPSITTKQNIDVFRGQIKRLGFSYDWSREISTTDPNYVRWTQWIFLKLLERGLAYEAEVAVNWCAAQGTVLANEEVKDGKYVETGDPVERRLMRQWMLRITAYADRLLDDLDDLDWPEGIKAMQRNWIGKSQGAEVDFVVEKEDEKIRVFTTRPDTMWGGTYLVLSPEHPLVTKVTQPGHSKDVRDYVAKAKQKTDFERSNVVDQKTGVFTGAYATNPANGKRIPIWVADYVLMSYGTGAVIGVPAHDERDHAFARAFKLPIVQVVSAPDGVDVQVTPWEGDGQIINSPDINGLDVEDAKTKIIELLTERGVATPKTHYRLRDWLFSRQRYWGEPFPLLHLADGTVVPVPEDSLPILPPALDDYRPTDAGDPPLARAEAWRKTTDPSTGAPALRETNTMPQWAGSCWYYLRFIDPHNDKALIDPAKERYWMPVDLYIGGAEHAVLHLLYARFWHKVLYDIGVVSTKEPFRKLFNQGMILAYSYKDAGGKYFEPDQVKQDGGTFRAPDGTELTQQVEKMSKSRHNVVNPDDVIEEFGADAVRLYEMFMGPLDVAKPWQMSAVEGVRRFLNRAWRLVCNEDDQLDTMRVVDTAPEPGLLRLQHKTIKFVTDDIDGLRFNTAIARLMEMVNALTALKQRPRETVETLVLLLSPFAPHIAEELWQTLGHTESLAYQPWPEYSEELAKDPETEYAVQINGRLRHTFKAAPDLDQTSLLALLKNDPAFVAVLKGRPIVKEIVVPGRLVNFVVRD
jgi:leucyl-tRNA synthetase